VSVVFVVPKVVKVIDGRIYRVIRHSEEILLAVAPAKANRKILA